MRLDDFDPNINVGDQRGSGGGFGGGGGGGMLLGLLPLIGSKFGCGGIIVVVIVLALFGMNPLSLLGGGGGSAPQTQVAKGDANTACRVDAASKATCDAFSSAENTWERIFAASGEQFRAPSLQFYSGNGGSGCGAAQAAMGPFYCPTDGGIYLDTTFYDELGNRFGAKGDFAQYYVIAHEFGHHIQSLTGQSERVQREMQRLPAAQGNALSVRLELQADCYAGVWAKKNEAQLDPGDIEEGMTAAQAIGDDTLQKQAQGRVVPDSFTHGSSAQRMEWLRRGLQTGDPAACDTFGGAG
ncbi:MAG: neutral zinc metallopeptidase [Pseudomonadota bacterium]